MKQIFTISILVFSLNYLIGQPIFEDFEDATITYTVSVSDDLTDISNKDYFGRISPGTAVPPATVEYTNEQGTGYYGAQDTDGANSGDIQIIELNWTGVDITGYTNLMFSIYVAEDDDGANQDWDPTSSLRVEVQIDGNGYNPIFAVESDSPTSTTGTPKEDTNFDGLGNGAEITDAFTQYSKSIGTGLTLDLRITVQDLDTGDEDIAIDNVSVSGTAPLPINLSNFSVTSEENSKVRLNWITESEINSDYFGVEYSSDGRDFLELNQVQGAGTTYETQNYHFLHEKANTGINYYRLRMIDLDGTFTYSPIEAIRLESDSKVVIRPSIAKSRIELLVDSVNGQEVEIEVINSMGQTVLDKKIESGIEKLDFDIDELHKGHYFVRVKIGNVTKTARFIKI